MSIEAVGGREMNIGYARASTRDQNLDLQIDALTKADCIKIFEEHATGKNMDRPKLQELLEMLREGDRVVVWKLDRIGRNTKHLIELVEQLEEKGVEFYSIQDNIDTSTAIGKFFFRMMASLAEFERDLIIERTNAGLSAARARGKFGGRPKTPKKKIETAFKMYDSKEYSISEICESCQISDATLYRYLNKRNKHDK